MKLQVQQICINLKIRELVLSFACLALCAFAVPCCAVLAWLCCAVCCVPCCAVLYVLCCLAVYCTELCCARPVLVGLWACGFDLWACGLVGSWACGLVGLWCELVGLCA